MRRFSTKCNGRRACRPGLIRNIAQLLAIDGVRKHRSPALNIEFVHRPADLFVGRKGDRYIAVLDRRILFQDVDHRHQLGYPGFIIGTK